MCSLVKFRLSTCNDATDPDWIFGDSFWMNVSSVTCNVMAWAMPVPRQSIAVNTPMRAFGLRMGFLHLRICGQRSWVPAHACVGHCDGQHARKAWMRPPPPRRLWRVLTYYRSIRPGLTLRCSEIVGTIVKLLCSVRGHAGAASGARAGGPW